MKVKKKNLTRFASLSALTAGALAVAPGDAKAAIIFTALPNPVVGPDGVASFIPDPNLPGGAQLLAQYVHNAPASSQNWAVYLRAGGPGGTLSFMNSNDDRLLVVTKGANNWDNVSGSAQPGYATVNAPSFGFGRVAIRTTYLGSANIGGNGPFDHEYALFSFNNSGITNYGWVELSLAIDSTHGPNVTLEGWAYENTGALINAGDTGVPEPSSFALLGLGALALGATGVRRWRKARKAA